VTDELARQPIAGFRDLATLFSACGGDRSAEIDAADMVLAQIVAAGLEGRKLAVRIALQRVLGALVQIAVRRSRVEQESCPALFDELCSTAWMVIATYPLARRPRLIAANISRDCEYLTFVRPARLHHATRRVELVEEHEPAVGMRGTPHHHAADELADLVRGLSGATELAETELTLLNALASGASIAAIADALGCTDRTVRNRRHRLVAKLREVSTAA
jgi:DNA-binding CsgD family transcriptional regulator